MIPEPQPLTGPKTASSALLALMPNNNSFTNRRLSLTYKTQTVPSSSKCKFRSFALWSPTEVPDSSRVWLAERSFQASFVRQNVSVRHTHPRLNLRSSKNRPIRYSLVPPKPGIWRIIVLSFNPSFRPLLFSAAFILTIYRKENFLFLPLTSAWMHLWDLASVLTSLWAGEKLKVKKGSEKNTISVLGLPKASVKYSLQDKQPFIFYGNNSREFSNYYGQSSCCKISNLSFLMATTVGNSRIIMVNRVVAR
jgi:hypothetical protein